MKGVFSSDVSDGTWYTNQLCRGPNDGLWDSQSYQPVNSMRKWEIIGCVYMKEKQVIKVEYRLSWKT